MKGFLILLAMLFAYSSWSAEVTYPTKNYKYISDWDYRTEVQDSDKFVLLVFSNNSCLEWTIPDRSCFLFERKLDYFIPGFSPAIKVIGFNTYFENYQVVSQFQIQKVPTVILMKNNSILRRMEASYELPDVNRGRMGWQDELLKQVLETVRQIH